MATIKYENVIIRVTPEVRSILTEAARRSGLSLTTFLLGPALQEAAEVLEEPEPWAVYRVSNALVFVHNDGSTKVKIVQDNDENTPQLPAAEVVATSEEDEKDSFTKLLENLNI